MSEASEDLKPDAYLLINAAFNEKTGRDLQETDLCEEIVDGACDEVLEYISYASELGSKAHDEAKREAKRQAVKLNQAFQGNQH